MNEQYDLTKELSIEECSDILKKYKDYLADYVEYYRGQDLEKVVVPGKTVDTACVMAVAELIRHLTGVEDPNEYNTTTIFRLSELLRITITLDEFTDMGLLRKSGDGYLFSKRKGFKNDQN